MTTATTLMLFIVTAYAAADGDQQEDASSLKLVSILYRHGDRTPVRPFPNDQWKDSWPEGLGQLTNVGKEQQFLLGRYLRRQYDGFLGKNYNVSKILVRSTNVDRTLMSAYCNLAGLFPPNDTQRWNPNLDWQPIPVHTLPVAEDFLLSCDAVCPRYDELLQDVKNSAEVKAFDEERKDLYGLLTNYTGETVATLFDVSHIYDTLYIEKLKNKTLPSWLNDSLIEAMEVCDKRDFQLSFKTEELRRLRGGSLVGEMVRTMEAKLNGKNESVRAYVYSAHDMTIVAFLSALNLYNDILPPYASAVIVELHESQGNRSVTILYRNNTDEEPYELQLPDCPSPCSFERFRELTSRMVPKNIVNECKVSAIDGNVALIGAIAGSILGCALLLLIAAAYALYHRSTSQYQYINIRADM